MPRTSGTCRGAFANFFAAGLVGRSITTVFATESGEAILGSTSRAVVATAFPAAPFLGKFATARTTDGVPPASGFGACGRCVPAARPAGNGVLRMKSTTC